MLHFKCYLSWVVASNFCDILTLVQKAEWQLRNDGMDTGPRSPLAQRSASTRGHKQVPSEQGRQTWHNSLLFSPSLQLCPFQGGSMICLLSNSPWTLPSCCLVFLWTCLCFFHPHHLLPRRPTEQLMEGTHVVNAEAFSCTRCYVLWCWSNQTFQHIFQGGGQSLQQDQVLAALEAGLGFTAGFPGIYQWSWQTAWHLFGKGQANTVRLLPFSY